VNFVPHTPADVEEMLRVIGVTSVDDLFADIPSTARLTRELALPPALSEQDLATTLAAISRENQIPQVCLLGAGAYRHYIPAVVRHLMSRSEFVTAYTPYQAEISQGILQALYEYQTMILQLTEMEVTNASLYDGATATAEACLMATRARHHGRIVVSRALHPTYRAVLRTYGHAQGWEICEVPYDSDGRTDMTSLEELVNAETAVVVVQSPNFFGVIEHLAPLVALAHERGALFCSVVTEALSLGLLVPPGRLGVDFVAGEGQSLGLPVSYGGPYLGILATRQTFLRRMPGRIVGATTDATGKRGFVLTLQAREQHIRRERATSNICSNETLCALAAAIYLAYMGKGLYDVARENARRARYLASRLEELAGWRRLFSAPFFNEFVMEVPDVALSQERLARAGMMGGYVLADTYPELSRHILFCVTEMTPLAALDQVVTLLSEREKR